MKMRVLWVGKTQEEWLRRAIDDYAGRIRRSLPLEIVEAREEKGVPCETVREREGERLARLVPRNAQIVLLDERGEEMTSPEFARFLGRCRDSGLSVLMFAIGGPFGFGETFRQQADRVIALSRMTFTHQMARVFLLEQIYRGLAILNNEPYHH